MRILIPITTLFMIISLVVTAQDDIKPCNPDGIFNIVEHPAFYTPGVEEFNNTLGKLLEEKLDKQTSGVMYVSIGINCSGHVFATEVKKSFHEIADKVVCEELEKLQEWTSAVQNETNVDYWHIVRIEIKNGELIKAG